MDYRPQSPDLSGYKPRSNSDYDPSAYDNFNNLHQGQYQSPLSYSHNYSAATSQPVTSAPQPYTQPTMPSRRPREEDADDEFVPDAPENPRAKRVKQEPSSTTNGHSTTAIKPEPASSEDPTLGCHIKTSFPVARIKRIMQADDDIGKVAQVTPTVVSRALELFMIQLISGAAHQVKGTAGTGKGPRRVLVQHLKKAVLADQNMDFLEAIVEKVPDAPVKGRKDAALSDSEDGKGKKRRGKGRKASGDDSYD